MCLKPVRIKNPNQGKKPNKYNIGKDLKSQYINVPCGHCKQCIALDQMYLVQRLQMECLVSHPFFCTLTYNNERLPKLTTSTGYDLTYVAYDDLTDMFKRLRRNNTLGRPFRYFAVTERGKKGHRPHIHLIWLLPKYEGDSKLTILNLERKLYKDILDNWVTNIGCDKKPVYMPNCTYVRKIVAGRLRYNYDLHYCDPGLTKEGVSEVGFYVLKYMLKKDEWEGRLQQAMKLNLEPDEYWDTYKKVKSRGAWSKGFGLGRWSKDYKIHPEVLKYLRECINKTPKNSKYPCFFTPTTGAQFPLAPFFKKFGEILTADEAIQFIKNRNPYESEEIRPEEFDKAVHEFQRIQEKVEEHDLSHELDLLYDE